MLKEEFKKIKRDKETYERLFQDDPNTLPGTIIIRGVKRYTNVMRELRYRRPMMSDFRDLDKVMSEFLREMNSFRQEFWWWKELKLKSNEQINFRCRF